MQRKTSMTLLAFLLAALIAEPAGAAEYWGGVNAPDWSGSVGHTTQTWTFDAEPSWTTRDLDGDGDGDVYLVDGNGYAAESQSNPYGSAVFLQTIYGDSPAWAYIDENPMGVGWEGVAGMIGGMGSGALDFYLPTAGLAGTTEVWLQYVAYIPNGLEGDAYSTAFASASGFTGLIGSGNSSYEKIDDLEEAGNTGDWWRVTESWEIEAAGELGIYLRINTADSGVANIVDSVQAITRTDAVPVPAAVWLLGSGMLTLVGLRRKRAA
jgi:hypothetical protein